MGDWTTIQRCGWSLVWFGVVTSGFGFWGSWPSWAGASVVAPLLTLGGLSGIVATWLLPRPWLRAVQLVAAGTALLAVGIPQAVGIHARRYYTTDSAAFNQVAAKVLLHGQNPYTASLRSVSSLLNPAWQYWTYTLNGGHVTQMSYPAGSFLLQVPAMLLGFHHEIADWMDLVAWLVTGTLLFVMIPAALRWVAVLVFLVPIFVVTFSNGGTDVLFLPFLVVAVWRWDRYGSGPGAGVANWIGPVALGLACAIKQTPWFCVPFLLAGVYFECRRSGRDPWRTAGRYLAVVAAVFAVVNLPFVIWDPVAWLHGTLLPLTQPLVADGQGLVTIALHGLTGGVHLTWLTVAGALVLVALAAAYFLWYPRLKAVWLFLVPIALFIPDRSLSNYLVDLFPAALVAALTVLPPTAEPEPTTEPVPHSTWRQWPGRATVIAPLVGAVAAIVLAFGSAPLQLSVDGFHTANGTQELTAVQVTVRNLTGASITPHFVVDLGSSHPSGFWTTSGGRPPLVLPPGASATVLLHPPGYTWSPLHGAQWLVEAYSTSPNALSTSPRQTWMLGSH
ncbi:MAG: glycosyltransferase 87 family protein [Acidimicrobiales bacterium]